ncbi:B-cell receptor CD22-like [Silurus meridionalis]|uniref:B-cell receptor CD22-like n=1 Tax=Silurus meridionalis TaxID=175797 RepID=UPI001EECB191|nr:B-cell receptor CD22-like [Silurus meridionalis]
MGYSCGPCRLPGAHGHHVDGPIYALVSTTKRVESSSVNLTCSSDAKPPVENYTWFKENEASPVGSGQSYRALQNGLYYCEAQNIIGFKRLAAVSITIKGALGNEWSLNYSQEKLCALKGSTVVLRATYTHPTDVTVERVFWVIDPVKGRNLTDLRNDSSYSGRVEYLEGEQNHFSLRLSDVKKSDKHNYCCRIITNEDKERYLGYPGVILRVTDLQLIAPAEVTEGESVILTCKTTCSLTDPTFIWYKNTHDLTTNTFKSNKLHLQRVSSEDAGSYNCAVRGSEHLPSPAQYLSVRYPPKSVSVSISPSSERVEYNPVNLTCSSDANPPVENYTWFKENESSPVGSGQSYRALEHVVYYCEAQNKLGTMRSPAVSITKDGGSGIGYVVGGLGLGALISAFFWMRWKRQKQKAHEGDHQNIELSAEDDMYVALNSAGQTSVDVYHTLAELLGINGM